MSTGIKLITTNATGAYAIPLVTNKADQESNIPVVVPVITDKEKESPTNSGYNLYSCAPNQWDESTVVSFSLSAKDKVRFAIYSMDGNLIYTTEGVYEAGINKITLTRKEINGASGISFYRIDCGVWSASNKMIRNE